MHRHLQRGGPVPGTRHVPEGLAPPRLVAAGGPRPAQPDLLVRLGDQVGGLVDGYRPQLTLAGRCGLVELYLVVDLQRQPAGGQPVPEALVDAALAGPQRGDRLATAAELGELLADHASEQPAPPVRRAYPDERDVSAGHAAAGHRHVPGVRADLAGDAAVRGDREGGPVGLEDDPLGLRGLVVPGLVEDLLEQEVGLGEVVSRAGAQRVPVVCHTFVSNSCPPGGASDLRGRYSRQGGGLLGFRNCRRVGAARSGLRTGESAGGDVPALPAGRAPGLGRAGRGVPGGPAGRRGGLRAADRQGVPGGPDPAARRGAALLGQGRRRADGPEQPGGTQHLPARGRLLRAAAAPAGRAPGAGQRGALPGLRLPARGEPAGVPAAGRVSGRPVGGRTQRGGRAAYPRRGTAAAAPPGRGRRDPGAAHGREAVQRDGAGHRRGPPDRLHRGPVPPARGDHPDRVHPGDRRAGGAGRQRRAGLRRARLRRGGVLPGHRGTAAGPGGAAAGYPSVDLRAAGAA